ncbi:hypothetical protein H8F21_16845 [Pseudomonas sp. P66]|uniref:Uncharacterized protein n=1 Tax=Pseudomonas arcuscaelestis TaxID=2710591 RepID=A0ABS2C038_9PSED|nr:hypothetical protein [Pseudomonas arcuscaelestis]MBM5459236.1 hypothetical protein [Pseudomonas arcuscaelestis]
MTQPNSKAEYYQMKGMVADLSAEDQGEVMKAEAEVTAIAKRSDKALIGALMAMTKIAAEA